MERIASVLASAGTAALMLIGTGAALAQDGVDFYNGKTVNYVVATDPGGGYDTNGRLVAEFMQKYLPGSTFVVRNMPGAGHLIGANYVNASAPDGLTVGTFNTGLIYSQLIQDPGVKFDLGEMSWIGKVASDPRVLMVGTDSGIESFEDLMALEAPIRFAAAGVGSASTVESIMLIDTMGLPIELITGYDGNDGLLAIRRGEVQGILGARSSFESFVNDGHGRFIAQIGGSQTDVPQLSDMAESPEAAQAIALVQSQGEISRLTAGPPGIPADRLEALRAAFQAATSDPEFLSRAEDLGLPIDPKVGDEVATAVRGALDQPADAVQFLKDTLTKD